MVIEILISIMLFIYSFFFLFENIALQSLKHAGTNQLWHYQLSMIPAAILENLCISNAADCEKWKTPNTLKR